jgi:hypothetical protein
MKKYISTLWALALLAASTGTTYACYVQGYVLCVSGAPVSGVSINITGTDSCGDPINTTVATDATGYYNLGFQACPGSGSFTACLDTSTLPPGATLESADCVSFSIEVPTNDTVTVNFGVNCEASGCAPVQSCITSGFNGTSISTADSIWFNANFSAKGIPSTGATVVFNSSTVTIDGTTYTVPGGTINFSTSVTCATTFFDGTQWQTTVPVSGSDEILLSAFTFSPTTNLKAANVTWCGDFSASTPGVSISWKWGAAVYTCLGGVDYNSVLVKPTHSDTCDYNNGDHAGTPENATLKHCVTGGARGGGGSNFTGSWSGTDSADLCP